MRIALALFGSLLLAPVAFAQTQVYCGNLPGCSGNGPVPIGEYLTHALTILAVNIPTYAYAAGVFFIMVGGAYMLLSAGREDWVTKGKTTITWAAIGIAATSFATDMVTIIQVQTVGRLSDTDFVTSLLSTGMNTIFDLLNISLLGVAIYCGMWMVLSQGKQDEFNKARDAMFWCGIGAIVINMAYAIARAIATL